MTAQSIVYRRGVYEWSFALGSYLLTSFETAAEQPIASFRSSRFKLQGRG